MMFRDHEAWTYRSGDRAYICVRVAYRRWILTNIHTLRSSECDSLADAEAALKSKNGPQESPSLALKPRLRH